MDILSIVAWASLALAFVCALWISLNEFRHPQKMWIMNIVWPVTALYFSVFALWAYYGIGRHMTVDSQPRPSQPKQQGPTPSQVAVSTSHCGAGCALADVVAEFVVFAAGLALFGVSLFASFALDLIAAWLLGIAFQYFTIKPMRNLSAREGLAAAIQADTLSIIAFQIGMYAWMALVFFVLFPGPHLRPNQAAFWLMMQIGMIAGFFTSYPMNRWLLKRGIKEAMG
ncbi:MAG: DUF4396 domain-containing protein [Acidobacteriaceae bacterium]